MLPAIPFLTSRCCQRVRTGPLIKLTKLVLRGAPYLENGNPGVAYVVKVDGPLVRVVLPGPTHVIVLVPVNAAVAAGSAYRGGTVHAALRGRWHIVAAEHPVLAGCRTDERTVFTLLRHVVRVDGQVVHSVKEKSADLTF